MAFIRINLLKIASILGLVQGVLWTALCLTALILYYSDPNTDSYFDSLNANLYKYYFCSPHMAYTDHIVPGPVFDAFVWLLLILHVSWTGLSIYGFVDVRNKFMQVNLWCYCTLIIALLDFVFTVIFGVDYGHCLTQMEGSEIALISPDVIDSLNVHCVKSVLIPMIVTAKGFIFFLLNVVVAFYLLKNNKRTRSYDTK